jgi:nucleoside-diphosphate-sugar epimerase
VNAPKRVLVTGARGFIGRRCIRSLAARGHDVVAVTRDVDPPSVDGVSWRTADLLDSAAATRLIADVRPTHLLHLAWYTTSPEYWTSEINEHWARASAELARTFIDAGGRGLVAAGTCAEYLWLGGPCIEDRTPLEAATFYGRMKNRAHGDIADLAREAGIPCAWARSFFVYGPGEEASKLMSSTIARMRAGAVVPLAQPDRRLDFVHVDDVSDAFARLVECEADGPFNVGTGRAVPIKEVVGVLERALGAVARFEYGDGPQAPDVVADIGRLSGALPWRPLTVEQGVASMIEGYTR